LNREDGIKLYQSGDLLTIGYLGNFIREKLHGKNAYFNVNRHIEPTNVCILKCGLCAFGKNLRSPEAYTFSLEEIFKKGRRDLCGKGSRYHLQGKDFGRTMA